MTANLPRLMVAAPASGSGKTTLILALLQALQNRGLAPAAFKCGPDYIDPLFHREVLGIPGYNLDLFLASPQVVRGLLNSGARGADIALLEGAMGYYDGAGMTAQASSWHLAWATRTPTLLVLRPGGAALSVAAVAKGMLSFRRQHQIAGVLLTDCSPALAQRLAPVIEQECGVPVYGCLPRLPEAALESRRLGLVTPSEVVGLWDKLQLLAQALEQYADLEGILALARTAPPLEGQLPPLEPVAQEVPIAVARDEAFCFSYKENLELLEVLGARIRFFSPLRDQQLPPGTCGLYLGGGCPELHAQALGENESIRRAIGEVVAAGVPAIAECGGFLYLQQQLTDREGNSYPMVGALAGEGTPRDQMSRFGYLTLTGETDSLLGPRGTQLRGHEFHYWDSTHPGAGFTVRKPHSLQHWSCGQVSPTLYGGFPHLYFWSNPQAAASFVAAAEQRRQHHD